MKTFDGFELNDWYSGGQQDIFVLSVFGTDSQGTFVDIGCKEPINHSNTALLEKYGWKGIGIDINDYSMEWKYQRPNSKFIHSDALKVDYKKVFEQNNMPNVITYLSLDLDGRGIAFQSLKDVIETGYEFKILTIEHDAYSGNTLSDTIPQRKLLKEKGYVLVRRCDIIEDFWINPKYIIPEQYNKFIYTNEIGQPEIHFWKYCKNINYDFTKLYRIQGIK
jgi:hypothetical protein